MKFSFFVHCTSESSGSTILESADSNIGNSKDESETVGISSIMLIP